jgi:uncharacterized protein (TIGR03083 family)
MDDDARFDALARQRGRVAALLDDLDHDEWDVASWCDGWQVRHVVGHMVSLLEVPMRRFFFGSIRHRGFDRCASSLAIEWGSQSRPNLRAAYRATVDVAKAPPRIGPIAPLVDVVVHAVDITGPLGRDADLDPEAAEMVLAYLTGDKTARFLPSVRVNGLRVVASGLEWESGSGPVVEGPAGPLAAALSRRRAALDHLGGDGVAELSRRLG